MLNVLNNMQSLREGRVLHLCSLWRIQRTDGVVFTFTDNSSDILFVGETYKARGGFTASARQKLAGLQTRNQDFMGVLSSEAVTNDDLHAGKFDGARITIFLVDSRYPWAGTFERTTYLIDKIQFDGEKWNAEVVGLTGYLARNRGDVVSPACMNDLGDPVCRVNMVTSKLIKLVATVEDARLRFTADFTGEENPYVGGAINDGYFTQGKIVWQTGANEGFHSEVQSYTHSSGEISLELQTPYDIAVGDEFSIVPGCSKLFDECKTKFDNKNNFVGCPHVPGNDKTFYPQ